MKATPQTYLRLAAVLALLAGVRSASAQATAFTYEGRLNDNNQPATGSFDFRFSIFDAESGGRQVGNSLTNSGVPVSAGFFSAVLDFGGAVFDGNPRWLALGVRTNGSAIDFTTLAPRQPITSTPYSVRSLSAATADAAASASQLGGVAANQYVQTADPRLADPRLPAAGSSNYIQNTTGTAQTQEDSSFNISGNGSLGGQLTAWSGVLGNGTTGAGVTGLSSGGAGVYGYGDTYGISGNSFSGTGVFGTTDGFFGGGYGVYGLVTSGTTNAGVYGKSTAANGSGVLGQADSGANAYGIWGKAAQGKGVVGESNDGYGVYGTTKAASGQINVAGVYGKSTSTNGNGVMGEANSGPDARGVWGSSSSGTGVYGSSSAVDGIGVEGRVIAAFGGVGVSGRSSGSNGNGVYAEATGSSGIGLYAKGPTGIQVWGDPAIDAWGWTGSTFGVAARFAGEVDCGVIKATGISGTSLNIVGTKNFRIDHPLDPANKYLYHASIESSEVMNLYSGNVTLDTNGEAVVQLPNWFGALNTDFRYQLTAIGAPGPNLYIAEEISNNRFKIAGGKSGAKVSWQVTGRRQDPYIKTHPLTVEAEKTGTERGKYVYPEGYGASAADGIIIEFAKRRPAR